MKFDFRFHIERHPGQTPIDHEVLLKEQLKQKNAQRNNLIDTLLKNGITVSETEYVVSALFRDKNLNLDGYRNRDELNSIVQEEILRFRRRFTYNDTVRSKLTREQLEGADRTYTEYNGVAGSIIASNSIFELTDADFSIIEEGAGKTLDFETRLASLGNRFLIIESKGTMGLSTSISEAANHIISKKNENDYKKKRDIYLGFVTQIPFTNETGNGKITLVDPEIPDLELNPLKVKFMNRLSYYYQLLSTISYSRIYEYYKPLLAYLNYSDDKNWKERAEDLMRREDRFHRILPPFYYYSIKSSSLSDRLIANMVKLNDNEFFVIGMYRDEIISIFDKGVDNLLEYRVEEQEINFNSTTIDSRFSKNRDYFSDEGRFSGKLKQFSSGVIAGTIYTRN